MNLMTTTTTVIQCDYCEESLIEVTTIKDHREGTTHEEKPKWMEKCGWTKTKRFSFCSRCTRNHSHTHLVRTAKRKAEERRTAKQEHP